MRWAFLALAPLGLGCTSNVAVPAPDLEGLTSILLFALGPASRATALPNSVTLEDRVVTFTQAFERDQSGWTAGLLDGPATRTDDELYVLGFVCPLRDLGLPLGPLALGNTVKEVVELPAPIRPQAWRVGEPAWRPVTATPAVLLDALAKLPIDGGLCDRLAPRFGFQDLPELDADSSSLPYAVPAGDQVIVGSAGQAPKRVFPSGEIQAVPIDDLEGDIYGMALAEDGYWFLHGAGGVSRGPLQGAKVHYPGAAELPVPRRPIQRSLAMAAGPETSPVEVFIVTQDRHFQRFDGERWESLARQAPRPLTFRIDLFPDELEVEYVPSVLRLGPGHALALGVADRDDLLTVYDHGQLTQVALPRASSLLALGRDHHGDPVVSDSGGRHWVRTDQGWESLGLELGVPVWGLFPGLDELLISGFSLIGSVSGESGVCGFRLDGDRLVALDGTRFPDGTQLLSGGSAGLLAPMFFQEFGRPGGRRFGLLRLERRAVRCGENSY